LMNYEIVTVGVGAITFKLCSLLELEA